MKKLFLLILLFALNTISHAEEDFLHPDKAFALQVMPLQADHIEVTWDVAKGYYLYNNKISFTSSRDDIKIKSVDFPNTELKNDPTFGEVKVHKGMTYANLYLDRAASAQDATTFDLSVRYQGCKDKGICYTPVVKKETVELLPVADAAPIDPLAALPTTEPTPTAVPSAPSTSSGNPLKELIQPKRIPITTNSGSKVLPVDQAFQFITNGLDQKTIQAAWQVTPNHHLYREKISFRLIDADGVTLGTPEFPQGKVVNDEYFGQMEVYAKDVHINLPLIYEGEAKSVTLETSYQGCSVLTSVCYQPQKRKTTIDLSKLKKPSPKPENPETDAKQAAENNTVQAAPALTSGSMPSSIFAMEGDIATILKSSSFLGVLAAFFIAGLFLAFTPCIFPMIPILSGVIAGYDNLSSRKAFGLSLAYVTASATAYALIGVVFGFFGDNLQILFQHPASISVMVVLFVLFAFSMFGFYELQMPTGIQSRLNEISNRQRSGSFIGAAIMGFLSTLIVGPCTGPVIAGALAYIAQTKDALLGGSALFVMGMAMGLPLLIVGTSAGHLLPRAGAWMDTTKAIFGIIMLGMGIWMLDRIVDVEVTMALTSILLIISGIYMGGLDRLREDSGGWRRFWKGTGLVMVIYGLLMLLGVSAGSSNLKQPLLGVLEKLPSSSLSTSPQAAAQNKKLNFVPVTNVTELDNKLMTAKGKQQLTILKFEAKWCTECTRMNKNTFANPEVIEQLKGVQLLVMNVTDTESPQVKSMLKAFDVIGPPLVAVFGPDGRELKQYRMQGYYSPENFMKRFNNFRSSL